MSGEAECAAAAAGCTSAVVIYGRAHGCDKINGHQGDHMCAQCGQRWAA